MDASRSELLLADLKAIAEKYNLQDILAIYTYPVTGEDETFSIGTATIIYKDSVFFKHLTAVKRHLVTGKFWEGLV